MGTCHRFRPRTVVKKGTGDHFEISSNELLKQADVNPAEQGQTANIKQNTTNKGFFKGRRIK
jgi:hypothetical protein